MKKEEILKIFYPKGFDKPYNKNKLKDEELIKNLKLLTNFLNENVSFSERLYCLKNDFKPNVCECGNLTKFKTPKLGYAEFCSRKCMNSSKKTKERRKKSTINSCGGLGFSSKKISDKVNAKKATKPKFDSWKNRKPVKEILENKKITPYFEQQVTIVLNNRKVTNDRMKNIALWVKYDIEDNYLDRFDKLLKHPRNDSSSKEIYILRYGEKEGLRRFEEKSKNCAQTEKNMIKRYGKKEGLKKWKEYKNNISFANSKYGYIKKYGETEGKTKFKNQCERNSGNLTLERKIELFGEEEGLKKYNEMKETQHKKHSLENYIRLYGEEDGTEKWEAICKMHSYKNSLEYYIEQYGEEEGTKRIKEVKNNGIYMNNYSKISMELFNNLKSFSTKFGSEEEIIHLDESENKKCNIWNIKPDFLYKNKIIEFNGDRFHGNPKLYTDDECCHPFQSNVTAKEMRTKDKHRNRVLENRGYDIKIVWESDFRKNKNKVIEECKQFLEN